MIDPKFNNLPAGVAAEDETDAENTGAQSGAGATRPRRGYSISETIAGDSVLSVGARGVDTSGVTTGAGAAAGMSNVTPGSHGESPAPNIVPGARGSGTTVRGTTGTDESGSIELDRDAVFSDEEISARAYDCWCRRGRPSGSPHVDWDQAIQELRAERLHRRSASA
jgi:hypothetical protein